MKIGFIGTGSMGSILIEAFLASEAVRPNQVIAANRTVNKAIKIAEQHPGLRVTPSNIEVVEKSEIVFICVKPNEYRRVLAEIKTVTRPSHIVISITSPVLIQHLEEELPAKIVKIIPSITNRMLSGAVLCIHGNRMLASDRLFVEQLLANIGRPMVTTEDYTRISSDISSCGPAFVSYFIHKLVDAAVEETGISREQAEALASEMIVGTGRLLTQGGFSTQQLQDRVAVPGGITAEGLHLLEQELAGVFNRLIQITHAKYDYEVDKLNKQFATET